MTSNHYLDSVLFPICKLFRGTYSCNTIPRESYDKASYIVNLSPVGEVGTHFICIIKRKSYVYYFDSYGLQPYNEYIMHYLKSLNVPIYHNTVKIQHEKSKFCGYFCMLKVLITDTNCKSPIDLNFYTTDIIRNDRLCIEYITKAINSFQK
jgi:hypothetical protein